MPEEEVVARARQDEEEGKSPSTQAGEFVREEIHHIREGKHGVASTKQAIAIGLSKARRAGVDLPQPNAKNTSARTHKEATQDSVKGRPGGTKPSKTRSGAILKALKREGHSAASRASLSRQAKSAAQRRGPHARKMAARRAVRTKGSSGLRRAGRKAARGRRRG